jgi:hypothetical protein
LFSWLFSNLNISRFLRYGLFTVLVASIAYSQGRINDKDLEHLIRNLRDDAKSFRSPFKSALNKSTIRKTSKAKDAENLAALFAKQTEALLNNFKRTKKGDSQLDGIRSSAQQLGTIVNGNQLGPQVTAQWEKIQTELQQVLSAYGINTAATRYFQSPYAGVSLRATCRRGASCFLLPNQT